MGYCMYSFIIAAAFTAECDTFSYDVLKCQELTWQPKSAR
jgi:hypothetical protein